MPAVQKELVESALADADAKAVDAITLCIVDLPTAILLSRNRIEDPWARNQLTSAVRAVLTDGPPSPTTEE